MRYLILAMLLLPVPSYGWGPVAIMGGNSGHTVTLTSLAGSVGGVYIYRSDNVLLGTLTAEGQSVSVPPDTEIYAKSAQALPWQSSWVGEFWTGYRVTLTGATDGNQSAAAAETAYGASQDTTGSAVCQTGNVTVTANKSVTLEYVAWP